MNEILPILQTWNPSAEHPSRELPNGVRAGKPPLKPRAGSPPLGPRTGCAPPRPRAGHTSKGTRAGSMSFGPRAGSVSRRPFTGQVQPGPHVRKPPLGPRAEHPQSRLRTEPEPENIQSRHRPEPETSQLDTGANGIVDLTQEMTTPSQSSLAERPKASTEKSVVSPPSLPTRASDDTKRIDIDKDSRLRHLNQRVEDMRTKTGHLETQIETMRKNHRKVSQDKDDQIRRLQDSARKDKQHGAAKLMQLETDNKALRSQKNAQKTPTNEPSQSLMTVGLQKTVDRLRKDQESWREEKDGLEQTVSELLKELREKEKLQRTIAGLRNEQKSWRQEEIDFERKVDDHRHERQEEERLEQRNKVIEAENDRLERPNRALDAQIAQLKSQPVADASAAASAQQSDKALQPWVQYSRMMHHDWLSGIPPNLFPIDRDVKLDEISRRPSRKERVGRPCHIDQWPPHAQLLERPPRVDPRHPHVQPLRYRSRPAPAEKIGRRRATAAGSEDGDAEHWPKHAVEVRIPPRSNPTEDEMDEAGGRDARKRPLADESGDETGDAPYVVDSEDEDSDGESADSGHAEQSDGGEDGLRNASLHQVLRDTLDLPNLVPTVIGDPKRLAFHEGKKNAKGLRQRGQQTYYVGRDNHGGRS